MSPLEAIRVVIRSPEGRYLARGGKNWEFTADRNRAIVFDYVGDHVADHLDLIRMAHGPGFEAVSVEPSEINETCDQCGRLVAAHHAFFDGKQFLCSVCRRVVTAAPEPRTRPGAESSARVT